MKAADHIGRRGTRAARALLWRGLRMVALGAIALCAAVGSAAAAPPADNPSTLERSVKAAFLYKFLGYAEFPAAAFSDAAAPLAIGVLGADELAAELTQMVAGRTVQGRAITVRTLREGEPVAGVHLLFIGGADAGRVKSVLKSPARGPLLLVSEAPQGLQSGSVINFKIVDERVRFDVSLDAADRNNVKLSSRLLTVANQVLKGAP